VSQHFTHYVQGLTGTVKTCSETECLATSSYINSMTNFIKIFQNLNVYVTLKKKMLHLLSSDLPQINWSWN